MKHIGKRAFATCLNLERIDVAVNNKIFDSRNNCNAIIKTETNSLIVACNKTVIPKDVISIERGSFESSYKLEKLIIPSSVEKISSFAFWGGFEKLTNIVVEQNNPKYDSRSNCNAVVETATNTIILGCINTTFPQSIDCIDRFAFKNSKLIEHIIIPDNIRSLQLVCFNGCDNLRSIVFPENIKILGTCLSIDSKRLQSPIYTKNYFIKFPSDYRGEYSVPDGIEYICADAFKDCRFVSSVALPQSVKEIGNNAFENCENLVSISLLEGIEKIEKYAFQGCSRLESVVLPSTVKEASTIFNDCEKLSNVIINSDIKMNFALISNCPSLINEIIYSDCLYYVPKDFSGTYNLAPYIKKIKAGAFIDCKKIEGIYGGNDSILEVIESQAFRGCRMLTVVRFESLLEIGTSAFEECGSLCEVHLPTIDMLNIANWAFANCNKLETIDMPNYMLESIGIGVFENCTSLKSIIIPNCVRELKDNILKNCIGLQYLRLPNSLTSISKTAFEGTKIEKVDMHASWNQYRSQLGLPPAEPTSYRSIYRERPTGAFTNGRLRPCPYCGSDNISTYVDGSAECHDCGGEYYYA